METSDILETIRREAVSRHRETGGVPGIPLLRLKGQSAEGVKALLDQELMIRFFPFHIGRTGDFGRAFGEFPHLALADRQPYRISRRHAAFERRGKDLFIVDPASRSGSSVDGQRLGERVGGARERILTPGRHDLRIGDERSPLLFSVNVLLDDGQHLVSNHVRFRGQNMPVPLLYGRFCLQTEGVFSAFFEDHHKGLALANDLIQSLVAERGIIDPLFYFSAVPDAYDNVLVAHALNLAIYTVRLAAMIPIVEKDIARLALAALLHDVGMYQVPTEILNKRDPVTAEEHAVIQRHTTEGQAQLLRIEDLDPLVTLVALEHHERIDGRGYPRGIKTLSEYVELIAILDFFEALTHRRPQRGPITPHEGVRLLIALQKAIFSPAVLKLFLRGFSLFPVYSVVRLNTGEIGQVVATHPDWPLRPTIRIFFDHQGNREPDERKIDLATVHQIYIEQDISDGVFVDHYFKLDPTPPDKGIHL